MIDELLDHLEDMPALLRQVVAAIPEGDRRRAPAAGAFSLVEQVWHLADVEREGQVLQARQVASPLVGEEGQPQHEVGLVVGALPGHATAGEVGERRGVLGEQAPDAHTVDATELARRGVQEGVGSVTVADVAAMMAGHDHSHVEELLALVTRLAPSAPRLETLRARAASPVPPARGTTSAPAAA